MSKFGLAILLFLAFYTTLAQPGLPACWLEAEPCSNHPHFHHDPYTEHDHEYLRLHVLSQASVFVPTSLIPAIMLIAALGFTSITRVMAGKVLAPQSWGLAPEPPPPRLSYSTSFSL